MKAIIDELNPGSVIEVPSAEQIVIVEVPKIGICISVLYRNMMTWVELSPLLKAMGLYYGWLNDEERLNLILGKTILITQDIADDYHPLSKDIE